VHFACVKDGSENQQNNIFEWYTLSSSEKQYIVCEGILEAGVLH
jgi:hypothetical protein